MKKLLVLITTIFLIALTLVSCGGTGHVHAFGEWETTKPATCIKNGEKVRYCDCGEKQTENISATGVHNEVVDMAIEPTCTTNGLTEGKHCADCDAILVKQTVVPVTEHVYKTEYSYDDDCHWFACKNCNSKKDIATHQVDDNGICAVCNQPIESTEGVIYIKSLDGTYAEVIGYNGTASTVIIANTYEGVPVKTIYSEAFAENESITTLIIPDNVVSIGEKAFYNCINLTSVIISDGVITIDDSAFENCSNLVSLEMGESVQTIGNYAFNNCSNLSSVVMGDRVTSVGDYAFGNCSSITLAVIGDSVTSIGDCAFYDCHSLTSVVMGDNVVSIGDYAFYDCAVTSMKIPGSVSYIGYGAFSNCSNLKYNTYKECNYLGNESNPYHALISVGSKYSSTYTIHGYTKVISGGVFESCTSFTSIIIPDSVVSIGKRAFYHCSSLTEVIIGNSVTSIGSNAFYHCTGLTSVVIGNSVTSIGDYAFGYCDRLTSVVIPDSVITIDQYAFRECTGLTEVIIGNSVTSIGDCAFYDCSSLTEVIIGNSVTSIGELAFYDCDSLTEVIIGNSVTSIGDYAFGYCDRLTSVVIPDSVTSIGSQAFDCCSALKDVYYTGSEEEWAKITIGSNNYNLTNATIHYNYVPEN